METEALDRECRSYGLYLTGQVPPDYIHWKYHDCHHRLPALSQGTSFDRLLVRISRVGAGWARFADCYAVRFHKHGMLRKKLVLMLALLECAPASFEYFDGSSSSSRLPFSHMAWTVAVSAAMLAVSFLVLLPVELGMRLGKTR